MLSNIFTKTVLILGVLTTLTKCQSSVLTEQELAYLGDDPEVTHKVTFEMSHKKTAGEHEVFGSLTFGLFGTVVPKTVENFVHLANMTHGFGYHEMIFHRIIDNFLIQGGDFEYQRGTGGKSIHEGGRFEDENFELSHNKKGRVSMANSGPNTNRAQFFVTNVDGLSGLDGTYVVFGQVIGGFDVLSTISKVTVGENARPVEDVFASRITIDWLQHENAVNVIEIQRIYIYIGIGILIAGALLYLRPRHERRSSVNDGREGAYGKAATVEKVK